MVRPDMCAGRRGDLKTSNPHAVGGLADTSFKHIAHAQFTRYLLHVDCPALICEAGVARDYKKPGEARDRSSDLLDDAIDEIVLLGVPRHVLERQYRDRRLVGQWQWLGRGRGWFRSGDGPTNPVHTHWPEDVLDLLVAQILEGVVELVAHLV